MLQKIVRKCLNKMADALDIQLRCALKTPTSLRSSREKDVIYNFLHGLEALSGWKMSALHEISTTARYEYHEANDILYCRGELATCWYILLSGSVFIDGCMFLPRNCFGKRTSGCSRRPNECLILEPSEMIAVDYTDFGYTRSLSQGNFPGQESLDHLALATDDVRLRTRHQQGHLVVTDVALANSMEGSELSYPTDKFKRSSHASDTSSAYSGSDKMQSSSLGDDQENDGTNSYLDSDDEESDETTSLIVRDTVRECLEKDPQYRTEDDKEVLLEFMQHLPAFANMTLATRRELCAVMVYAVVDKAGTIVMEDNEELDSWSVILNGHVEIERPDGTIEHLHMGDSFGVAPTQEKLFHKGTMKTKVDDCQFVCIAQDSYYKILHQGQENISRTIENGQVVLISEKRKVEGDTAHAGYIVIRGTSEKLLGHLMEEHSAVDATYVEDFLMTFRTFIKSPVEVAEQLKAWFSRSELRDKVTRVVLLWVNNHYNDFETNPTMSDFLEHFETLLEENRMGGQLRLLNIACAAKAQPRRLVLSRKSREEVLPFQILGGLERNCGIFVSSVHRPSKASEVGLKRGDEILEVNNHTFQHISHKKALEILRGSTHLAITVKSNLLDFKEMLSMTDNSVQLRNHPFHPMMPFGGGVQPVIGQPRDKGGGGVASDKKGPFGGAKQNKLKKKFLDRLTFSTSNSDTSSIDGSRSLKSSLAGSETSSPKHALNHSLSNPDLRHWEPEGPDHVLKVFRADQSFKYLMIHRETSAHEVVMLSLKEFGLTEASSHFSLCEVSVEGEGYLKTRRLPDQLTCLPDRLPLNARYYIKNNESTEPLVPDELIPELQRDCNINLLQLDPSEVAAQLMLRDFLLFRSIEPSEYIDDLFELVSGFGTPHLATFSKLVNTEMFWVITEVCSETNLVKRVKLLKHFIKVARHCKECKNFNSMFAIVSGLGHGSVSRLRSTWEKLPSKYIKMFEDMQDLMDPSRNMSKYRNLLNSEKIQPPLIPFFPVIKKDLTFIHLGNDSRVDSLINFEKLRMIAKEIRHSVQMASSQYDMSQMYLRDSQTVFSVFNIPGSSVAATLRRKKRTSALINPKKIFDEAQMVRRVRAYLQSLKVEEHEVRLTELSHQCEPSAGARRGDATSNQLSSLDKNIHLGPKFGAESPQAVQKLMGLSEKSRPYNTKAHPLPPQRILQPRSPVVNKRPPVTGSPGRNVKPQPAVSLSAESSSVMSLSKVAKGAPKKAVFDSPPSSDSPTSSVGSSHVDTDSGHNSITSITSSSMDRVSNSSNSPQGHRRDQVGYHDMAIPPSAMYPPLKATQMAPLGSGVHRVGGYGKPPPPPYEVVVQNYPAPNRFAPPAPNYDPPTVRIHPPTAPLSVRPRLPDYHAATHMARRQHQLHSYPNMHGPPPLHLAAPVGEHYPHHGRSRSYDLTPPQYYQGVRDEAFVDGADVQLGDDDEQVSAV